jgi:hypothetical protein
MVKYFGRCRVDLSVGLKELITGWDKVELRRNTITHDPNLKKYGLS